MKMLKRLLFLYIVIGGIAGVNAVPPTDYVLQEIENHQIHLLEIDPKIHPIIAVKAYPQGAGRKTVTALVKEYDAYAGINGGFFQMGGKKDGKPAGVLKIKEDWYGFSTLPRAAIAWNQNGESWVDRVVARRKTLPDGSYRVEITPQLERSLSASKKWQSADYIVGGVGLLMKDGVLIKDFAVEKGQSSFWNQPHARTGICIKPNRNWLFVVASQIKLGDAALIEGLTMPEFGLVMQQLGCQDAINLDGGGSSTLVLGNKVMNQPLGDKDELPDMFVERPVSDAILALHH